MCRRNQSDQLQRAERGLCNPPNVPLLPYMGLGLETQEEPGETNLWGGLELHIFFSADSFLALSY